MKSKFAFILRCILTLVFGVAGLTKALNPSEFAFAIDRYQLGPWWLPASLALYLPWLELIAAGALWWPKHRAGALTVCLTLSSMFVCAITSALWRGLDISCGCFGEDYARRLDVALVRAMVLAALCVAALLLERRRSIPEN